MVRNAYVASLLVAALAGTPALAVQLTNRDANEQKVTITEKSASREIVMKPSETLDGICNGGCTMQLAGGEEYVFDGNERLSIEENIIFLDEPAEAPPEEPKK